MTRYGPFIAFMVALAALVYVLFAPWAYPQTPPPCRRRLSRHAGRLWPRGTPDQ